MKSLQPGWAAVRRMRRWGSLRVNGHFLLGLILLLAFALRAYRLGAQAIWWDESLSLYRATRDLATILGNTITFQNTVTYDTLPPLYFVFLHAAVAAFGTSEFALRFLSLAVNVATIPLLYVTAKRWLSRDVAFVAAFLGALSPFYIWYSQEARPYALVLFETLLAVYALTRAFGYGTRPAKGPAEAGGRGVPPGPNVHGEASEIASQDRLAMTHEHASFILHPSSSQRSRGLATLILYFVATAASLYTHYHAVFLIPFHVVLIAILVWPRRGRRRWLSLLLPAVPLAAAVFAVPLVRASMAGNVESGPADIPLFIIVRDLLNSFSAGISVNLDQVLWIDAALFLLFLIGLAASLFPRSFNLGREALDLHPIPFLFLVAFLAVPIAGLEIASIVRPLYLQSRYFITLSPPFYLGLAAGIVALARRARLLALPAVAIFLIGATLSLNNLYWNPQYAKDDNRAWADYLREHVQPGDYLFLDSPHTEALFEYYANDLVPWASLPVLHDARADAPEQDLAAVQSALSRYPRVWFLQMDVPFDDPGGRIEKMLNQQGLLVDNVSFAGTSTAISLSLYLPSLPTASPAQIAHPLNVAVGSQLRLVGYDAPAAIESGGRAAVKLYWELDERVGEDFSVSLRLHAPQGPDHVAGNQYDAILVGAKAGSSTWPAGQIVADSHELPIAPGTRPGRYQLEAQVYRPATGQSIGSPVMLGEIEVERPRVPLAPQALPISHLDASLGAYRLVGSDWPDGGTRPGDVLPVALYFQIVDKPKSDLVFAVDLAQRLFPFLGPLTTRAHVSSSIPAQDLAAGDIVRNDVSLRVPADASGDYELQFVAAGAAVGLGNVRVQPLARATNPPPISHPFSARVGDAVEFLGYDLNTDEARRGGTLSLTLYWRARRSMQTSYTVFTHVIDGKNQIVGQKDNVPVGGTRPTTGWAPGEVITDSYAILLSDAVPPGKYPIEIGLYDAASGARLPTFDANGNSLGDRILLPPVEVR